MRKRLKGSVSGFSLQEKKDAVLDLCTEKRTTKILYFHSSEGLGYRIWTKKCTVDELLYQQFGGFFPLIEEGCMDLQTKGDHVCTLLLTICRDVHFKKIHPTSGLITEENEVEFLDLLNGEKSQEAHKELKQVMSDKLCHIFPPEIIALFLEFAEPIRRRPARTRDFLSDSQYPLGPVRLDEYPDISDVRSALSVVRATADR